MASAKPIYYCPECRTRLVIKHAQAGGWFWGCSSYPNCRWSRPITPAEAAGSIYMLRKQLKRYPNQIPKKGIQLSVCQSDTH